VKPSQLVVRLVLGLVLGGLSFSLGFVHLVVFSMKLTGSVIRGEHPVAAVSRMSRRLKAEPVAKEPFRLV
jgi:hypothetical protein